MCEKEPKRRSCTECPQYDGMKCTATDFTLGDRDEVLQQEHRRGFICLDTGEAELKGDDAIQWTAEQERLRQEKGYKSCEEMWAAEGKQVMCGFRIDKDNEHLEPLVQISNGPGPVKLTFQYEENAKSVDDTMYHPNQPENQQWYTVEARADIGVDLDLLREHNPNIKVIRASELEKSATADCIADMLHKGEGGPLTNVFTGSKMPDGIIHMVDCNPAHAQFQYRPEALPKYAGSPSSECPSLRDGPPQKGKIAENKAVHNSQRLSVTLSPDATCGNCNKSHTEGDRLVCDRWGLQDILMPYRPCEKWALDPNKIKHQNEATSLYKEVVSPEPKAWDLVIVPGSSICTADDVSISERHAEDNCITYVSNTPKPNAVFTDEEISQLKDAMHTIQRILEQHGVTL